MEDLIYLMWMWNIIFALLWGIDDTLSLVMYDVSVSNGDLFIALKGYYHQYIPVSRSLGQRVRQNNVGWIGTWDTKHSCVIK